MTTPPLPGFFDVTERAQLPVAQPSFAEKLAAYFHARPGEWIDGMELARVAGSYAWRSRASELRKPPFNMTIENRVRRIFRTGLRVSEYRFVPDTGSRE
jgi:hypothetical protein